MSTDASSRQDIRTASPFAEQHPQEGSDELSLLDILILVFERKRMIVWTTIGAMLLSAAVSFLLPPRFTAVTVLVPPEQNSSAGSALASQLGALNGVAALAGGGFGTKTPNDMYVAMLKSQTVEDGIVERFGLMHEYRKKYLSDARRELESRSSVVGNGKDGLITIRVEDRDANRAAELANGYIENFRKLSEHLAIGEASQRRLFFEQQLEQAKDNLATSEEALKVTEQKTGLIQLDGQARALIESATSLRAQIAAKEVQIQSLGTFATQENSQLVQAQSELQGLRSELAKLGGGAQSDDVGLLDLKGKVPEQGLEYIRKQRDVKYYETIFEILARQFETAKLDEARQGALIQVLDPALPPDKRSFPKRGLIVIGASLIGLIAGIIYALIQSGYDHLSRDMETARKLERLKSLLSFRNSALTRPQQL
jgi:tyrosine-protein kinase Etk/Wzc